MFNNKILKDLREDILKVFNECENKETFNAKKFRRSSLGKSAYLTLSTLKEMFNDPKKQQIAESLKDEIQQEFDNLKQDVLDGKKELESEIKTQDIAKFDEMVDEEIEKIKNQDDSQDECNNMKNQDNEKDQDNSKNESYDFLQFLGESDDEKNQDDSQDECNNVKNQNNIKNQDDEIKFEDEEDFYNESNDIKSQNNNKNQDDQKDQDDSEEKNESEWVNTIFGSFVNESDNKDEDDEKNQDDNLDEFEVTGKDSIRPKDSGTNAYTMADDDLDKNGGHGNVDVTGKDQVRPKDAGNNKYTMADAGLDENDKEVDEEDDTNESSDGKLGPGLPWKRNEKKVAEDNVTVSEMATLVAKFIREQEEKKQDDEEVCSICNKPVEDCNCSKEQQDKNVKESFIQFYRANVSESYPGLSKSIKSGLIARCEAIRENFLDAATDRKLFNSLNESEQKDILSLTGKMIHGFLKEATETLSNDTSTIVDSYIAEEVYPELTKQVDNYIKEEMQPELFEKFNAYMNYVAEEIVNEMEDKKLIVKSKKSDVNEAFIDKLLESIKNELKIVPEQEDALEDAEEKLQNTKDNLAEARIEKERIKQKMIKLQKENWILKNLPNSISESRKDQIENMLLSLDEDLSVDEFMKRGNTIISESIKSVKSKLDNIIKEEFEEKPPKSKRKQFENYDDFVVQSINRITG